MNEDPVRRTLLPFKCAPQPELPGGGDQWPSRTREWWAKWGSAAQAELFTDSDWEFLLETALLHAQFWGGETRHGPEIRLRVAKFGATPEDRQRLRYEFAEERPQTKPKRRGAERFADLRVIPGGADSAVEA